MTIPAYRALAREWRRIPPLRWMLAAQIGLKTGKRAAQDEKPTQTFEEFKRQCQAMGF